MSEKAARPGIAYRKDLDGLRGAMLLVVIAYHIGFGLIRGGFVAVDTFFVMSGYLISSILVAQQNQNTLSLKEFYIRRVRRIVPAMILPTAFCLVAGWRYFFPGELKALSESLVANTFSLSNMYLLAQTNYFGPAAETLPLLHTWSLSVEEQFYLGLPLFLILARRWVPRHERALVMAVSLVSLVVSSVGAFYFRSASFYLAPTRAWEFMLGTLLAMGVFPSAERPVTRNVVSVLGLGLIVGTILLASPELPFPGLLALLPCVGTALLIVSGVTGPSWAGRLLSMRPLVFAGVISYSVYLWHWPFIVFQMTGGMLGEGLSPRNARLAIIALTFAVGWVSWKVIEVPFRRGSSLKALAAWTAGGSLAVVLGCLVTLGLDGGPTRFTPEALKMASHLEVDQTHFREGLCFLGWGNTFSDFSDEKCLTQVPTKKNYLLVGDSHAAQLWAGLAGQLDGVNLMQATASGCKPYPMWVLGEEPRCLTLMRHVFDDYLPTHHVDRLLISSRWTMPDLPRLEQTLDWAQAHGFEVTLFGPMVQYDGALPRLLALGLQHNDPEYAGRHRIDNRAIDDQIAAMAKARGIPYVSWYRTLCVDGRCDEVTLDGVPLVFDYGHLTKGGSLLVAQRLAEHGLLP